jgi:anti-sigma-K factor RskA
MSNIPDFSSFSSDTPRAELLAGYVLGDLSSDEMILVQQYIESNPDAIVTIEELKSTLSLLPLGLDDITIPAHIKTNLFASLDLKTDLTTTPIPKDIPNTPTPPEPIQSIRRKIQNRWFMGLGTLAAATIAALGLQSYQLQQEFSATRQELARLRENQDQAIAKLNDSDRYQQASALMLQPGSRMLTMTGNELVSGASGNVVIVPEQNRAVLTIQKMPPPPIGKVYHLWAIVNSQKIACIQFVPESNGQVLMQIPASRWSQATQVAITIEPDQSESQPTGEMVMSGEKI